MFEVSVVMCHRKHYIFVEGLPFLKLVYDQALHRAASDLGLVSLKSAYQDVLRMRVKRSAY